MKNLMILTLALGLFYAAASPALAQEQPKPQPTETPSAEEVEKEKAEREKNAFRLLDQVIDEAQSLRLIENRVRVQVGAADMLWDRNQGRARSLFAMAGEGVAELGRSTQSTNNNPRRNEAANQDRRAFQMRQELVLAAAKHDAQLAYQLLAATKPPVPVAQPSVDPRVPRPPMFTEDALEQTLLGRIAALDPKFAAQNAEQMMEKGQFPRTVTDVINQLYKQDPDSAAKLADKTVKKIQAANLLQNNDAATLAQSLIMVGPRVPGSSTTTTAATSGPATGGPANTGASIVFGGRGPVLDQSQYVELLSTLVDAALKITPATQNNNQRPATGGRPTPGGAGIGPRGAVAVAQSPQSTGGPTPAQTEQINASRLFGTMTAILPLLDQYLPSKASTVRQKMGELGMTPSQSPNLMAQLGQNPSVDALIQAAATAPQQVQARLYQQAAYKALDEGNADRARQITNDLLPANMRDVMLQRIETRELAKKDSSTTFEQLRQVVNRLTTDTDKINTLIDMASAAQKENPKLATQLLDEARQMINHRASNYEQFEQQLRVAHAFAAVDPARSFEILDPGISQINELLSAAAILNGFEMNMFRDGEMSIQTGNGLTSTIYRFGQELAELARVDFERSDTLAGRFQLAEPRIITRLAIVQGLLNPRPQTPAGPGGNPMRGVGQFSGVRPQ